MVDYDLLVSMHSSSWSTLCQDSEHAYCGLLVHRALNSKFLWQLTFSTFIVIIGNTNRDHSKRDYVITWYIQTILYLIINWMKWIWDLGILLMAYELLFCMHKSLQKCTISRHIIKIISGEGQCSSSYPTPLGDGDTTSPNPTPVRLRRLINLFPFHSKILHSPLN